MEEEERQELTRILAEVRAGIAGAVDRLFTLVYKELRALAGDMFRQQAPNHTMQPTAIVHEAYARMVNHRDAEWKDKAHFMAVAAKVMRNLLVDHARKRKAAKRGGDWDRITLDKVLQSTNDRAIDILALEDALTEMAELNERMAKVVELRFYGGLTVRETAAVIGVARATVDEDWAMARAWLTRRLDDDRGEGLAPVACGV